MDNKGTATSLNSNYEQQNDGMCEHLYNILWPFTGNPCVTFNLFFDVISYDHTFRSDMTSVLLSWFGVG